MSGKRAGWSSVAAGWLTRSESVVLFGIGALLVLLAVLLLFGSFVSLLRAVVHDEIGKEAIEVLNGTLLVLMLMEIVYTVAISLQSHTLVAEPFLIIGVIAAIRRILVITAVSMELEREPALFRNRLVELGMLGAIVIVLTVAVLVLRHAHRSSDASVGADTRQLSDGAAGDEQPMGPAH